MTLLPLPAHPTKLTLHLDPLNLALGMPPTCAATRKDGNACSTSAGGPTGYCVGHAPTAHEARRKGSLNESTVARLERKFPPRYHRLVDHFTAAIEGTLDDTVTPQQAQVVAGLTRTLLTVYVKRESWRWMILSIVLVMRHARWRDRRIIDILQRTRMVAFVDPNGGPTTQSCGPRRAAPC